MNVINLIHNDTFEVLPKLENASFDIAFTSVPFKYSDLELTPREYWIKQDSLVKELCRICSKAFFIIQSSTNMNEYIKRYAPKRTLIWGKGIIQTHTRYNPIFCHQISDEYKINKYIWSDCFGVEPISGHKFSRCSTDKVHKYQDPLLLYKTIISMFKNIYSILDPFMGSGTTGIVCNELGIDFTGIEINKAYFDIAKTRLNNEIREIYEYQ